MQDGTLVSTETYTVGTSSDQYTGLTANTDYTIKIQATGDGTNYLNSPLSSGVSVHTYAPAETATITWVQSKDYVTVPQGFTLEISASVSDGGNLTYQWFHDGIALSGKTTAKLEVTGAVEGDNGAYLVQV